MRNKEQYPAEWKDMIRPLALKRDGYKCTKCKVAHRSVGYYDMKKVFVECDEFMRNRAAAIGMKLITIYLNVHHIDGNPGNNEEKNLRSYCAKCHFKQERELRKLKRIIKKL
jgi:ribosomal protein L44E